MSTRCPVCRRDLGRNAVLEPFPVGRRISFDPERGRLWAVCGRCRCWSLAPLEERWEAVEAAEHAFERAVVGASTDNVMLSRASDGTRLLRIGKVDRSEFAAWRYGRRLRRRWKESDRQARRWGFGSGLAAVGAITVLSPLSTLSGVLLGAGVPVAAAALRYVVSPSRRLSRLPVGDERVSPGRLARTRLRAVPGEPAAWRLEIPGRRRKGSQVAVMGADAMSLLRRILPGMNPIGGSRRQIASATEEVVRFDSADGLLQNAIAKIPEPGYVASADKVLLLALEMAVNDDIERRALEGDLLLLEREWREAEEVAAISDELLVPAQVRDRLEVLREGERSDGPGSDMA